MKLLITGDLVINQPYNASKMIDQKIVELFNQSDYNIVNLEAPVTNSEIKQLKTGPNLKADKNSTLSVLNVLQVDAVTLANNHVLDYGKLGIADTLQFCKSNKIATVGAGMNIFEASQTLYIDTEEGKIAIINFAENEWSAATINSAGFNPMNVIDNANQIQEAHKLADYVIVIIHGGHEYYNLPSPRMQKQYRFYADQGADIVVGNHTHCISGNEVYRGVPIYYSLGNFLFTENSLWADWYNGLILEIEIKEKKLTSEFYIVEQAKETFKLLLSNSNMVFERISVFNSIIAEAAKLQNSWEKYVDKQSKAYLNLWSPLNLIKNRYLRAALNKLNISLINKKGLSIYLNLMRCEAHRDLSNEIIKKYIEEPISKNL
ncbi:CapA family protein [Proteiniphilum sp.]|uniref:CapA family protein n=1 Tax=Proteiniphilum sp. TaxID=1926877 RepID=UPI00332AE322